MNAYHNLALSYDRLTNDVDYKSVVDFYWEILAREGFLPETAVDLACGTGSVALILAEKGLTVTAVDMSTDMLCAAADKARDMENRPTFVCQKLQEYYSGQHFVTVMPFGENASTIYAAELAGTNHLKIVVCGHEDQTSVTALFDNLGKGASGAAVQNMNIMLGIDEATGLE